MKALNAFSGDGDEVIANVTAEMERLTDTAALEEQKRTLSEKMNVVAEMINDAVAENARVALDQEEYQKRYDGLVARYDEAEARLNEVSGQIEKRSARFKEMEHFVKTLKALPQTVTEFSDGA